MKHALPALLLLAACTLSACAPPAAQVGTATPAQVMIPGSAISGPADLGAAAATAQAHCRSHGRDARYTGIVDTGTMMWGPVPTRVFDCIDQAGSDPAQAR